MSKSTAPEATPGPVRVYPSPSLPPTDYLPGIGPDGADVSPEKAAALIASGLVTTRPPAAPEKE